MDRWMGWPMLGSIGINLVLQLASSCYLSKHIFFRFLCYVIFKELLPDINTDMSNMFCSVLHQITENIQRLKYANSVCGVSSNGLRCTK